MRQDGSRGCSAALATEERERGKGLFFLRTLSARRGAATEENEGEMLPIEMLWKLREMKEGGHDRVGLEALAGRLSRRGGSTPPEGDLAARFTGLRREGKMRAPLRGKGDRGDVGGVADRVEEPTWSPSYGPPPLPTA